MASGAVPCWSEAHSSPFAPACLARLDHLVELLARVAADTRHADALDLATSFQRVAEDRELAVCQHVAQVDQLQTIAQVGLVRAVAIDRLGVGQPREGRDQALMRHDLVNQLDKQPLDQLHHVLLLDEAHLHIELGELGLAVGAQILVAEAARDLEVLIVAGDHQQLLELLRRLRQRVELAGVDAAGHQVIARALGRGLDQDRRLDLQEAFAIEEIADELDHAVAQDQVLLHALAPQIEVAILQAQHLVLAALFADIQRRRLGGVEHAGGHCAHLDRAGGEIGVDRLLGALADQPAHLQHILGARLAGDRVRLGRWSELNTTWVRP